MRFKSLLLLTHALLPGCHAHPGQKPPMQPSAENARLNSYRIFNAVRAVGRQWDSSIHHNGFSFVPAVAPAGTVLYHGSYRPTRPDGPEWLAFEVEHAEMFARSHPKGKGPQLPNPKPPLEDTTAGLRTEEQVVLSGHREQVPGDDHGDKNGDGDNGEPTKFIRGYLHTYQAPRDLNLLVIDGMSAAKVDMGTLDSQDYLLRLIPDRNDGSRDGNEIVFDEYLRAKEMCDLIIPWGYDGVVRMEVGFEVILCDFAHLDLVSATRSFIVSNVLDGSSRLDLFQWARAVGQRYDGLGGDRLRFDFSSMVSALFFPLNVSATDPARPDLVRLGAEPTSRLRAIRDYLGESAGVAGSRRFTVNWQAIVDMVVTRYADRFAHMASSTITPGRFENELDASTFLYVDAPTTPDDVDIMTPKVNLSATEAAIDRCAAHYLLPSLLVKDRWSTEDKLLHAAIRQVMEDICHNLFTIREFFPADPELSLSLRHDEAVSHRDHEDGNGDGGSREEAMREALEAGQQLVRDMMRDLDWPVWKKRGPCPTDEILFVAMWPFGDEKDHWNPGCRTIDDFRVPSGDYWGLYFPTMSQVIV
ncbi:hypothetical protein N3K66_001101 [Trichothecium roseum]|uniref:Uncharacterized protein n=1 Tax=Trichothecium roseum TaxID=47278 RepID=A0ACC0VDP4_9HYPO|nr:hypothetical protein N3K66_001101 [Trichothecium roseum]